MVGGLISLVWCLVVLIFALRRAIPGTSLFPEIDFASKLSTRGNLLSDSVGDILSTLSMANTYEISKALARTKFHLHINPASTELGQDRPVAVMECEDADVVRKLERVGTVEMYDSVIPNGKF
jgi:hypothetical protein